MTSRRQFIARAAALAAAGGGLAAPAIAQARPRVVIVGGGAGGASLLRALAAAARGAVDITLVEPQRTYTTCFYSNLYLGGVRSFDSIRHGYDAIAALDAVTVVHDRATAVDRDRRELRLAGGMALPYDRLVLSPGVALDYESVPGWSEAAAQRMPHAWQAGEQTALLRRQLDAVPDGGLVVVIAPPNPYRCPPGPYERVSMMAHLLKATGRGNAQIVVLDPKPKFSKQPLFQQGWERHYPGMVEWMPPAIHAGILGVEPETMSVQTGFETYRGCALVNVIPRQTAGRIAVDAGLAADNGYCDIDPFTLRSRVDDTIVVLGDATNAGDMPKSAYAASSQAQVAAAALAAELLDRPATEPVFHNRCWSLIDTDDSVVVGGRYRATDEKIEQVASDISSPEDTAATRRENFDASARWYQGLTASLFG